MVVNKQIAALLAKEMDRKEFLKHVVLGAVVLAGGGSLLRLMAAKSGSPSAEGYNATAYGGTEAPASHPGAGGLS